MSDFVTSDAVTTHDATLERAGSTSRPEVRLPDDAADEFPAGDVVRLVLDGSEYRTRLRTDTRGRSVVRGAFDTASQARNETRGENRLREWVDGKGLDFGRTVHVDVVEPGFRYGLRAPGERATYEAGKPSDSLASIAEDLDG